MFKDLLFNLFVCTALQNTPRLHTGGKKELSLCIYILKEIDLNNRNDIKNTSCN
jgi:hypothetical protein